jgi:putative flippase GtrA
MLADLLSSIPLPGWLAKVDRRFIVFLFVGGINTLFGYAVFAALSFSGLAYPIALFLSTVAGVLFNFKTTGTLVFSNRNNRLLLRFIGVYSVVYLINVSAMKALVGGLHLSVYLAYALLILPMAVLSFVLSKKFVFVEAS